MQHFEKPWFRQNALDAPERFSYSENVFVGLSTLEEKTLIQSYRAGWVDQS
jgi:hypothetical protein